MEREVDKPRELDLLVEASVKNFKSEENSGETSAYLFHNAASDALNEYFHNPTLDQSLKLFSALFRQTSKKPVIQVTFNEILLDSLESLIEEVSKDIIVEEIKKRNPELVKEDMRRAENFLM